MGEWTDWHKGYGKDGPHAGRLEVVRRCVSEALDRAAPGPLRVVSLCAGDGRDLLEVLPSHPRRSAVSARLVDSEPALVQAGRARIADARLERVEFVLGDASRTMVLEGAVPAEVVLACGIFGNISDEDVHNTVRHLPELCAQGATVVWTRGRFPPDLTPTVRRWFAEEGFRELEFVEVPGSTASVGVHVWPGPSRPFRPDVRLFTFLPKEQRPSQRRADPRPATA